MQDHLFFTGNRGIFRTQSNIYYTYLPTGHFISLFLGPLIVGWSAIDCVNGLISFLHLDLSLARVIFRCFLHRSALTTSFDIKFGLPGDLGPSTLKLMIFFVHDVYFCQYKCPDSLSLFHPRTSLI